MSETLEQALLRYLFQSIPYEIRAYGFPDSDRLAISRLPEDQRSRVRRLCELNPVGAPDLVRLIVDIANDAFNDGHDEGFSSGVESAEREIRRRLEAQQARVREAFAEFHRETRHRWLS